MLHLILSGILPDTGLHARTRHGRGYHSLILAVYGRATARAAGKWSFAFSSYRPAHFLTLSLPSFSFRE